MYTVYYDNSIMLLMMTVYKVPTQALIHSNLVMHFLNIHPFSVQFQTLTFGHYHHHDHDQIPMCYWM